MSKNLVSRVFMDLLHGRSIRTYTHFRSMTQLYFTPKMAPPIFCIFDSCRRHLLSHDAFKMYMQGSLKTLFSYICMASIHIHIYLTWCMYWRLVEKDNQRDSLAPNSNLLKPTVMTSAHVTAWPFRLTAVTYTLCLDLIHVFFRLRDLLSVSFSISLHQIAFRIKAEC